MTMTKLAASQYGIIKHLINKGDVNLPAIFGVIEGLIPAQVWIDDITSPQVCLIICEDSYCIIAGKLEVKQFEFFLALMKKKQSIRLQCEPTANPNNINFLMYGFTILPRREYQYSSLSSEKIPRFENTTPYLLKQIKDRELFELCIWKQLMIDIYSSRERYLANAVGFILWDENKKVVVSEAHGVCSKEFLEIVTVTHENYRRQNLSTIITNHLIHYAIEQGVVPIWPCNEENIASQKVAEKQGMDEIKKYNFYCLDKK